MAEVAAHGDRVSDENTSKLTRPGDYTERMAEAECPWDGKWPTMGENARCRGATPGRARRQAEILKRCRKRGKSKT